MVQAGDIEAGVTGRSTTAPQQTAALATPALQAARQAPQAPIAQFGGRGVQIAQGAARTLVRRSGTVVGRHGIARHRARPANISAPQAALQQADMQAVDVVGGGPANIPLVVGPAALAIAALPPAPVPMDPLEQALQRGGPPRRSDPIYEILPEIYWTALDP